MKGNPTTEDNLMAIHFQRASNKMHAVAICHTKRHNYSIMLQHETLDLAMI